MSIHEHLLASVKRELKQVGWTGLELAKLARRSDGQEFDCATWLHKARELPKEEFRREAEKELTGRDTEPSEIVYFKGYYARPRTIAKVLITAARRTPWQLRTLDLIANTCEVNASDETGGNMFGPYAASLRTSVCE